MTRAFCLVAIAALALGPSPAAGGDEGEPVRPRDLLGRPAPALSVDRVLAGPEPAAWPAGLAGRAVVVDFWSTWCVPCVEGLPEWNALVDALAGEPVTFVAVSDEGADAVERFLEHRRLAGWVALDPDRSAFDAFAVTGIPQAVLIDAAGTVRGVGHTAEVTPEMVRRLIAGEETGLVPEPGIEERLADAGRAAVGDAIFEVGLWPARGEGGLLHTSRDGLVALGVGLRVIVPFLWEVAPSRVVLSDDLPAGRFDLVVRPGGDGEALVPLGRRALETGLGIEVRREVREVDALALRVAGGGGAAPAGLRPAASGLWSVESGPGRLLGNRVTTADLAEAVEQQLRRPVLDETGLSGEYEVELTWDVGDAGSLTAAVEALGLELVAVRREVEMAVVARREAAAPPAAAALTPRSGSPAAAPAARAMAAPSRPGRG